MIQGIIGKKLGMTQIYQDTGEVAGVTILEVGPCTVVQVKTADKDGYNAAQLGFGKARRLKSPERGHLKGLGEFRYLREFRLEDAQGVEVGQKVDAGMFQAGDVIDVTGVSKGKGFAGVVKRYHFAGGPKTHGQSDRHRAAGAIGSTTSPGRVWKGQRMAGHMGNVRVTALGLRILATYPERNLLLVHGAVPGATNGLLLIKKSSGGK